MTVYRIEVAYRGEDIWPLMFSTGYVRPYERMLLWRFWSVWWESHAYSLVVWKE